MQTKTIVWTVVILVLLALVIWGISSWGGNDNTGTRGNGGTSVTGGQEDADTLINSELVSEDDGIELGNVV